MEVILREDIAKLGRRGDIVSVKDGYARNYLLPRKLAIAASEANRKQVAEMKAAAARHDAREKGAAESVATQLGEVIVTITAKAGELPLPGQGPATVLAAATGTPGSPPTRDTSGASSRRHV